MDYPIRSEVYLVRDLHLGGGQSLVSQFAGLKLRDSVADMANRGRSRLKHLRDIALASKESAGSISAVVPSTESSDTNTNPQGSDTGEH